MRIKSYFANTVDEAMDKARRELGSEAMLMNSKKTELELRSLGAYEVIFAVPPEAERSAEVQPIKLTPKLAMVGAAPLDLQAPGNDLARELAELRKQIETVKRSVDRRPTSQVHSGVTLGPDGNEMMARLTGADMSEELAMELAAAVETRHLREGGNGSLDSSFRAEFEQRLRFAPALPTASTAPRAVLFVGPAGAGKTTTLVKLALRYGLRARLPLHLLSLDTLRIGGWENFHILCADCRRPLPTDSHSSRAFASVCGIRQQKASVYRHSRLLTGRRSQ